MGLQRPGQGLCDGSQHSEFHGSGMSRALSAPLKPQERHPDPQVLSNLLGSFSSANNESLEVLNLSWNHIRMKGAVALSAGLKVRICPCLPGAEAKFPGAKARLSVRRQERGKRQVHPCGKEQQVQPRGCGRLPGNFAASSAQPSPSTSSGFRFSGMLWGKAMGAQTHTIKPVHRFINVLHVNSTPEGALLGGKAAPGEAFQQGSAMCTKLSL